MKVGKIRLAISVAASLAVAAYAMANLAYAPGDIFMSQHLSFKHQILEKACDKCHTPWQGVKNESCQNCHTKKEHGKINGHLDHLKCATCHREHRGEQRNITNIRDKSCLACHNNKLAGNWRHKTELKPRRPGVLLSHATFFRKETYNEKLCDGCHLKKTLRMKRARIRPLKDIMYSHVKDKSFKCSECHARILVKGFSATGAGVDPSKCIGCHERRLVNVSCGYCHLYHNFTVPEKASAQ